jgi:hypothetical protein
MVVSDPCGNRTRLASLRGSCPTDRRTGQVVFKCAGQELNLQSPKAGGLRPLELANAQPTHAVRCSSGAGRSRTDRSPRFELGRFACLRTAPQSLKASPAGFEPAISCVTSRRALLAAPRGRVAFSVAQVGLEPTASLVLSRSGLPLPTEPDGAFTSAQGGSRTRKHLGLSQIALPVGVPGRRSFK